RSLVTSVPRLSNTVKITTALGVEDYPSWSPDGRAIAYQSDQAGNWDIWVTQVGNSEAVNRTSDSPASDIYPCWSPDGKWLAFSSTREGGGYFVMPGVGGSARKVVSLPIPESAAGPVEWSPDSSQLVYFPGLITEPSLEIMTLSDGSSRKLTL